MIKSKGNNIDKVENMGIISQKMKKTQGKNIQRIMRNMRMKEHKKKGPTKESPLCVTIDEKMTNIPPKGE